MGGGQVQKDSRSNNCTKTKHQRSTQNDFQRRLPDEYSIVWLGMADHRVRGNERITIRDDGKYTQDMPSILSDFQAPLFDGFNSPLRLIPTPGKSVFGVTLLDAARNCHYISGNVSDGISYIEAVKEVVKQNGGFVTTNKEGTYIEKIIFPDIGIVIDDIQFFREKNGSFGLPFIVVPKQNDPNVRTIGEKKGGGCGGTPTDVDLLNSELIEIVRKAPEAEFIFAPKADDPSRSDGIAILLSDFFNQPPAITSVSSLSELPQIPVSLFADNGASQIFEERRRKSHDAFFCDGYNLSMIDIIARQKLYYDCYEAPEASYQQYIPDGQPSPFHAAETMPMQHHPPRKPPVQEESMFMKLLLDPTLMRLYGRMYGFPVLLLEICSISNSDKFLLKSIPEEKTNKMNPEARKAMTTNSIPAISNQLSELKTSISVAATRDSLAQQQKHKPPKTLNTIARMQNIPYKTQKTLYREAKKPILPKQAEPKTAREKEASKKKQGPMVFVAKPKSQNLRQITGNRKQATGNRKSVRLSPAAQHAEKVMRKKKVVNKRLHTQEKKPIKKQPKKTSKKEARKLSEAKRQSSARKHDAVSKRAESQPQQKTGTKQKLPTKQFKNAPVAGGKTTSKGKTQITFSSPYAASAGGALGGVYHPDQMLFYLLSDKQQEKKRKGRRKK